MNGESMSGTPGSAPEAEGFDEALGRLKEIVAKISDKELGLEESLDLLEEGVRLANRCTAEIDQSIGVPAPEKGDNGEGIAAETAPSEIATAEADTDEVAG